MLRIILNSIKMPLEQQENMPAMSAEGQINIEANEVIKEVR